MKYTEYPQDQSREAIRKALSKDDKDYSYTLPDGRTVNVLTLERSDIADLPTLHDADGDELKIETEDIRVWLCFGKQTYDGVTMTDPIYVEELIDGRWQLTTLYGN